MYHASRREIPYRVKLPLSVLEIGGTPSVLSIMRNNVTANSGRNNGHVMVEKPPMIMTSQPRNITKLLKTVRDVNTGEMTASEIIETNDTFLRLKRRKRALKSFTDYFEPLYRRRKVTLLFITFTIANENGVTLRSVIDQFKKRCKRNGYPCHGYFWVMEISEDLHVHYHGLFAIDRMNVRGSSIPNWWKLDELWGARTTVEMVKRSVHGYLAKYMDKGHEKIEGKRMYGRSMPSIKNSDEAATKN
jgi:predicted CopG family antitoxin